MKTRLLFGFIIVLSSLWIGYALWMVKNQTITIAAHTYFSDNSPILFINRMDDCAPIPEITLGEVALNTILTADFFSQWKSIGIQFKAEKNEVSVLLEEQARIKDEDILDFINEIGLNTRQLPNPTPQIINDWTIIRSNGFLAIHNRLDEEVISPMHSFSNSIINRDIHSSYTTIDQSGVSDVYCHEGYNKVFKTMDANWVVASPPKVDLDIYSVLPSNTTAFVFWEKEYAKSLDSLWDDPSISNYIDNGVVLSTIDGNSVWLIDISGKYTPQEILAEFAQDKAELQTQIVKLNRSFGSVSVPYAMGLENILVLCDNLSVLEQMRISYQTGRLFIQSNEYQSIKKHGTQRVHSRWFNPEKIKTAKLQAYISSNIGHSVYATNNNQCMVATTSFSDYSDVSPQHSSATNVNQLVWNFSLENKNSRFYTNSANICVVNPDKKTVSIVNPQGKIATWVQLSGNLKTVHPMEGGFLIEQFDQLIWMSDSPPFEKKEIPFKGAIASSIAPYIWKGVPSISLISENLLYRISLKTGRSETNKIPQNKQITAGQLHAFNLEGDLAFGVFSDSILHIFNSKKNDWRTIDAKGNVKWSQKISGKVFYLLQTADGYFYRELLKNTPVATLPIQHNFLGASQKDESVIFSFMSGNEILFYYTNNQLFTNTISEVNNAERIEPLVENNELNGFVELDGVRNELIVHKNISTTHEKITLNASQFIKVIGTNSVITFVDGQLVMYSF